MLMAHVVMLVSASDLLSPGDQGRSVSPANPGAGESRRQLHGSDDVPAVALQIHPDPALRNNHFPSHVVQGTELLTDRHWFCGVSCKVNLRLTATGFRPNKSAMKPTQVRVELSRKQGIQKHVPCSATGTTVFGIMRPETLF